MPSIRIPAWGRERPARFASMSAAGGGCITLLIDCLDNDEQLFNSQIETPVQVDGATAEV
jgi:hypothetical protein